MIDQLADFVQAVRQSRLLGPAQLDEAHLMMLTAGTPGPRLLADCMVRGGWLTGYQAGRLLDGQHPDLVFGPYRVLGLLGEGGLCQVFKARHCDSGLLAALKVLKPELRADPQVLRQFRQEMEVGARLSHPGFVKALDIDLDSGPYYFAMEYVDGLDLDRLLRSAGPLPPAQACDYIRQAAFGLQYAYEQGLVHRDIKPANLIIGFADDRVRVLDIGLARLEWAYRRFHPAGGAGGGAGVMGTADYVAPEQAVRPEQADTRADIYSLGCTLYQLFTGVPPFPGSSLARKLMDHQRAPAPSARRLCPEIPEELAALVQMMMAKKPEDRPQTPAAVAIALGRFCQGGKRRLALGRFREPDPADHRPIPQPGAGTTAVCQRSPAIARGGSVGLAEHRRARRRGGNPISVAVREGDPGADVVRGWVLDRSTTGLGLFVEQALEVGTVVSVRPARSPLEWVEAEVRYCRQGRTSWRVGCQFVQELASDDLRAFG